MSGAVAKCTCATVTQIQLCTKPCDRDKPPRPVTYEQKLIDIRNDLRTMATELLDASEDQEAHAVLVAVLAIDTLSDYLSDRGAGDYELPVMEGT